MWAYPAAAGGTAAPSVAAVRFAHGDHAGTLKRTGYPRSGWTRYGATAPPSAAQLHPSGAGLPTSPATALLAGPARADDVMDVLWDDGPFASLRVTPGAQAVPSTSLARFRQAA